MKHENLNEGIVDGIKKYRNDLTPDQIQELSINQFKLSLLPDDEEYVTEMCKRYSEIIRTILN